MASAERRKAVPKPHPALRARQAPLSLDELLRLQRIVIGDERFARLGLRNDAGFVVEHDRQTHAPIADHISARPEDHPSLVEAWLPSITAL